MQSTGSNGDKGKSTTKPTRISQDLQFLESHYVAGTPALWVDFKQQCPEFLVPVPMKEQKKWRDLYQAGCQKWFKTHSLDSQAKSWFNNIRLGPGKGANAGESKISQVLQFLDTQYNARAPATWIDFKRQRPALSLPGTTKDEKKWSDMFHKGVQKWILIHATDLQATSWCNNIRPGPSKDIEQADRFFEWQYAANAAAAWRDIHRIAPHISYITYHRSSHKWRDSNVGDSMRLAWYHNVANLRIKDFIQRYLDWGCAANSPAPWSDFHKRGPQISHRWFNQYSWRWRSTHKEDSNATRWYD